MKAILAIIGVLAVVSLSRAGKAKSFRPIPVYSGDDMHPKIVKTSTGVVGSIGIDIDREYWYSDAQKSLAAKLKVERNENRAKNLIFFLGDGMGVSTVTSARIFKGQLAGKSGEETVLNMDEFPFVGTSKTYCLDAQIADSACSATAYLCGTKAHDRTIGVSPEVRNMNCTAQMKKENQLESILAWAQKHGKSTGIITTTRITHASPSGNYAHIAERDWENNQKIEESGYDSDHCDDIAEQLILSEPGNKINVILGGGRREFTPTTTIDPSNGKPGHRTDKKNLIDEWIQLRKKEKVNHSYIKDRTELLKVDPEKTDFLLGLFNHDHIEYTDKMTSMDNPQIHEMVEVAIKILSKNPKGFYLFVEGGRIDHAHHDSNAQRALVETVQFDKAIGVADSRTSDQDTLIVVTADHSHAFTLNGYSERGNDIIGPSSNIGSDGLPYPTLSYANGPGHRVRSADKDCSRTDMNEEDWKDINYLQHTMVELPFETHGGEDVLIMAKGPWAHLLVGVNQQSFIPHVMGYAACISPFANSCDAVY